jgi:hypothetical protein
MVLSCDCVLLSTCSLAASAAASTSGKAERDERERVIVYDRFGTLNEYISGDRLRSWTVIRDGTPAPGWSHIMPEDAAPLPSLPFTYRSGIGFSMKNRVRRGLTGAGPGGSHQTGRTGLVAALLANGGDSL